MELNLYIVRTPDAQLEVACVAESEHEAAQIAKPLIGTGITTLVNKTSYMGRNCPIIITRGYFNTRTYQYALETNKIFNSPFVRFFTRKEKINGITA